MTILLPTHDRADVVGFAIRSVLAQSQADWELLVVGDGCTDGTAGVVTGFGDPRIRWYDLPKAHGFGYANRNRALTDARGELVAFMAHDDLWLPDHLARMLPVFDDPRVVWAHSRPAWVSREGLIVPLPVDLRIEAQRTYALTESNTVPAACVVHRRAASDAVGGWPEDAPRRGDRILWGRIIDAAWPEGVGAVPEVTALHFIADWRRAPVWGARPFESWMPTLRPGPDWPEALQVRMHPDAPEQAQVWERLEADPVGWTAALRAATLPAIERLAWDGIHAIHERWTEPPLVGELERRIGDLETQLRVARRSAAARESGAAGPGAAGSGTPGFPGPGGGAGAPGPTAGGGLRGRVRRLAHAAPALAVQARVRNPLFDGGWYRQRYPEVRRSRSGAFGHWRRHGWREGRDPNPLFDTRWYLAQHPDVAAAAIDPLEHYLRWGARDGRDPSPGFATAWYRAQNPDVRATGANPLLHYLRHGRAEGRRPRPPRS